MLSVCLWIRRGKHSEKLDVIIDFIAQERTHKPINSSSLKRLYNLLFTIAPGSYQTLGEHLAACPGGCGHKKLRLQKRELGSHLIDLKKKKKKNVAADALKCLKTIKGEDVSAGGHCCC